MSRGSGHRGKRAKRQREVPPTQGQEPAHPQSTIQRIRLNVWRFCKSTWFLIGAIGALIGLFSAWLTLLPRISITSSEAINPKNPFTTQFVVSNDGYLDLYDIKYDCQIKNAAYASNEKGKAPTYFSNMHLEFERSISSLKPTEKTIVACRLDQGVKVFTPLLQADIEFIISCRPEYSPWRIERRFRFRTAIDADKKLHWFPRAETEPE